MDGANSYLDIEHQWVPKVNHAHDSMIMDLAIQYNFTASDIKQINLCRIYLQVLMLSDITTANGHRILPCILQGHRDVHRASNLEWPRSERPQNWSAWSRLLQHFRTGGRLSQPLGLRGLDRRLASTMDMVL